MKEAEGQEGSFGITRRKARQVGVPVFMEMRGKGHRALLRASGVEGRGQAREGGRCTSRYTA